MPLAAQQDVLVDEIDIFQFLNMQSGSQFTGHFLPATDSLQDIGGSGASNRLRWGFADVWNGEQLEITDSFHLNHWSYEQDAGGSLDLDDPANNLIVKYGINNVQFYRDLLPDPSSSTISVGTIAEPFEEAWVEDDFSVKGLHSTVATATMDDTINGGRLILSLNSVFTPSTRVVLNVTSGHGTGVFYNSSNAEAVTAGANSSGRGRVQAGAGGLFEALTGSGDTAALLESISNYGRLTLYGSGNDVDASVQIRGDTGGSTNGGQVQVYNSDASPKSRAVLGVIGPFGGGDDGYLSLSDQNQSGSAALYLRAVDFTEANQLQLDTDLIPDTANTHDLGESGREWLNVYTNFVQVRNASATATILSGSGAAAGACSTGSIALNTSGGAGTTLYVCESGSWVGK